MIEPESIRGLFLVSQRYHPSVWAKFLELVVDVFLNAIILERPRRQIRLD